MADPTYALTTLRSKVRVRMGERRASACRHDCNIFSSCNCFVVFRGTRASPRSTTAAVHHETAVFLFTAARQPREVGKGEGGGGVSLVVEWEASHDRPSPLSVDSRPVDVPRFITRRTPAPRPRHRVLCPCVIFTSGSPRKVRRDATPISVHVQPCRAVPRRVATRPAPPEMARVTRRTPKHFSCYRDNSWRIVIVAHARTCMKDLFRANFSVKSE